MKVSGICSPLISGPWRQWPYYYGGCAAPYACRPGSLLLEEARRKCDLLVTQNTAAANRLHRAAETLQEVRRYSPEELELAWLLTLYDGNDARYNYDTTGTMYIAAAVRAGLAARYCELPLNQTYRYDDTLQVDPVLGTKLDVQA